MICLLFEKVFYSNESSNTDFTVNSTWFIQEMWNVTLSIFQNILLNLQKILHLKTLFFWIPNYPKMVNYPQILRNTELRTLENASLKHNVNYRDWIGTWFVAAKETLFFLKWVFWNLPFSPTLNSTLNLCIKR